MQIQRLQVRNFMGLRQIDLKTGKVNVVKGRNRQGKTSLIRAIEAAFQEGDQSAKIREGADAAEILVELNDLYVSRTIPRDGKPQLNVCDGNGEEIKRPQEYLNSIVGGFSFNPAEFFLLDAKKQVEYVLESFPLKVDEKEVREWISGDELPIDLNMLKAHALVVVQKVRKHYYDLRTAANREVDKKLKAGQEQAKLVPKDFSMDSYDPAAFENLVERVSKAEQSVARLTTLNDDIGRLETEVTELRSKLRLKEADLKVKQTERDHLKVVNPEDLKPELAEIHKKRDIVLKAEKLKELRDEYKVAVGDAARLDNIVARLTNVVPGDLMARIKMPVPGLVIDPDGLTFNGKTYALLCGKEQIEVSLAIARALNGKFNIVCVDGIEKLDDESFNAFCQMMEGDPETQYFVTQVGSRGDGGVTLEDGTVKEPATQAKG